MTAKIRYWNRTLSGTERSAFSRLGGAYAQLLTLKTLQKPWRLSILLQRRTGDGRRIPGFVSEGML